MEYELEPIAHESHFDAASHEPRLLLNKSTVRLVVPVMLALIIGLIFVALLPV